MSKIQIRYDSKSGCAEIYDVDTGLTEQRHLDTALQFKSHSAHLVTNSSTIAAHLLVKFSVNDHHCE